MALETLIFGLLVLVPQDTRVPGTDELTTEIRYSVEGPRSVTLDLRLGNIGERDLQFTLPVGTPFGVGDAGIGVLLGEEVEVELAPGRTWRRKIRALPIGPIRTPTGQAGPVKIEQVSDALDRLVAVLELRRQGKIESDPLDVAGWLLSGDALEGNGSHLDAMRSDIVAAGGERLWQDIVLASGAVPSRGEDRPANIAMPTRPQPVDAGPADSMRVAEMIGLTLDMVPSRTRDELRIGGGARVASVAAGSIAERQGLKPGEVIYLLEESQVPSPTGLEQMLRDSNGRPDVTIRVLDQVSSREVILPLPQVGQRYEHPGRQFSLPVPEGWFVIRGHRNRVVDENFDTLLSPDGREVMIVYRAAMEAPNGEANLRAYEAEKVAEANRTSRASRERIEIAGRHGFRVHYRLDQTNETISRVAFVHGRKLCVINCVHPSTPSDALPSAIEQALSGIQLK